MAGKAKKPTPGRQPQRVPSIQEDARGKVRIYADIDRPTAVDLSILALRKGLTRKAMLEVIIMEATKQKTGV